MSENLAGWTWTLVAVVAGITAGLITKRILFLVLSRIAKRTAGLADNALVPAARWPARLILPTFGIQFALTVFPVPPHIAEPLNHLLSLVLIAGGCWLVIALIGGIGQWLASHAGESQRSAVSIRSFQTRIHLLTRVISVVVIVVAVAIVLLNIPSVRQLGASILASAGIAGVVAGFASKSILANILAGLQLAMTEPIRMGDVVVIDKDPGTVEEIGSSFVVVRLGETRRLIVPLNYFLENRFENWSLRSAEHLGTVTLRMDYQVSIKDLRTEMERILNASKHWDHKTGQLQAIDSDEKSIQIKVTVSAANPEELSKLRNDVREGLLTHLQDSRRSHEPPEPIAGSA